MLAGLVVAGVAAVRHAKTSVPALPQNCKHTREPASARKSLSPAASGISCALFATALVMGHLRSRCRRIRWPPSTYANRTANRAGGNAVVLTSYRQKNTVAVMVDL